MDALSAVLLLLSLIAAHRMRDVLVAVPRWFELYDRFDDALVYAQSNAHSVDTESGADGDANPTLYASSSRDFVPLLRVAALEVGPDPSRRLPAVPLDLELRAGERVVLVGPRGSGKSLVAQVLAGAARPARGCVLLDGRPLAMYNPLERQTRIRGLLQTDRLCNDSILGNLRVGNPGVATERLEGACALLGIDAEIRALPLGYSTPVVDDGRALSRGQRQLLLLARTIAADAAVTVLDEPLAFLDGPSARTALDALLRSTRTLVVLAADEGPFVAARFRVMSLTAPSTPNIS